MKKNFVLIIFIVFCVLILSLTVIFIQSKRAASLKAKKGDSLFKTLVCAKAFEALGRIGDASAEETLIRGLKSKELIMRVSAIEAIGRLGDKRAVPYLKESLQDDNYLVRIKSARALLALGEKDMDDKLFGFLENSDPSVRAAAVEQLDYSKTKHMDRLIKVLSEDANYAVKTKAIQQLGISKYSPASSFLAKELDSPNAYVRQAACVSIGKVGYAAAKPLLKQKFDDPESFVRAAAKEGYGMLVNPPGSDDKYIKLLWQDLESKDAMTRAGSFICLSAQGQVKVLPVLLKEVVNPSGTVFIRRLAARGLMTLKPAVAVSFDEIAKSKQAVFSSQNLELSYKVNGKSLLSLLSEALRNEKNPLHAEAAGILGELRDASAFPELRQALLSNDPKVEADTAYVLGLLKDKEAAPYLIKLCKNYGF